MEETNPPFFQSYMSYLFPAQQPTLTPEVQGAEVWNIQRSLVPLNHFPHEPRRQREHPTVAGRFFISSIPSPLFFPFFETSKGWRTSIFTASGAKSSVQKKVHKTSRHWLRGKKRGLHGVEKNTIHIGVMKQTNQNNFNKISIDNSMAYGLHMQSHGRQGYIQRSFPCHHAKEFVSSLLTWIYPVGFHIWMLVNDDFSI